VTDATDPAAPAAAPLLRVVRGTPTPEELAAVVAVVSARASGGADPEPAPAPVWNDRSARLRAALPHPGPGAWKASGLPR
jgi:hypothetical protein